jgi:hypothetical protein
MLCYVMFWRVVNLSGFCERANLLAADSRRTSPQTNNALNQQLPAILIALPGR